MRMPPRTTSAMRFFKVILSSTILNGKLKIPSKFVKYHGDKLAECVSLSVPSGSSWSVKTRRENDSSIWFHDGLLKFMEDNSIGIEFFITFEYRGGSKFRVLIFDLTATEIRYKCTNASPTSDVNQMKNGDIREGSDDSQKAKGGDDSVECLDSSAGHLFEIKYAEPSKYALTHNRGKCLLCETNHVKRCYLTRRKLQMLDTGIAVDGGQSSLKYKEKNTSDGTSTPRVECADKRIVPAENLSLYTSFKITLKSYHIKKQVLIVPTEFARLNMPYSTQLIKLVDSDDNEWVVRFTGNTRYLSSGWACFVKDKELMEGNICIFERVGGNQVKLKVHIYRSAGDFAKERNIEAENKPLPKSFEITLTRSYIKRNFLNVPSKFAPLLASRNSSRVIKLVDTDNNEWMVRYINRLRKHSLTKGWKDFVRDKKLMVGDVCTFKRVWGVGVNMKVTISRRVK